MNLTDRMKVSLTAFVRSLTQRYDYAAVYPCVVLGQNGDGSLELRPESPAVPAQSKVPVRWPAPGIAKATVSAGARVLLEFENADPTRPIVTAWENDGERTELVFDRGEGLEGTSPVARKGDALIAYFGPPFAVLPGSTTVPPTLQTFAAIPKDPLVLLGAGVITGGNPKIVL